ncbi:hypothetical protein [Streptomyces sp. NPDC057702]|uniref:hypothetical protein n=1 Tax=unclassified Streptomyces TaxID=2593676 RepID=UPI0036A5A7D0
MIRPRDIGYTDELLADDSVHRRYEDGRQEWRRRGDGGVVHWHDDRGATGTDELLGQRVIKRVDADGRVTYGRDIGYGRTLWGRGETVLVNRTSLGGRAGVALAALGVAGLAVTAAQLPPAHLTPAEEEALRQQQAAQGAGGGGGGGDAGGAEEEGWEGSWEADDGGWSDDDFG